MDIVLMLDGTGSDIVETKYLHAGTTSSMTIEEFKGKKDGKTLVHDNNPSYIGGIPEFEKNRNKENITFAQFNVKENGYYYIYTRDRFGNEEIKQIRVVNIDEFIPILT